MNAHDVSDVEAMYRNITQERDELKAKMDTLSKYKAPLKMSSQHVQLVCKGMNKERL